jgi:hypothetical protein
MRCRNKQDLHFNWNCYCNPPHPVILLRQGDANYPTGRWGKGDLKSVIVLPLFTFLVRIPNLPGFKAMPLSELFERRGIALGQLNGVYGPSRVNNELYDLISVNFWSDQVQMETRCLIPFLACTLAGGVSPVKAVASRSAGISFHAK